jgi:hypothetical protein
MNIPDAFMADGFTPVAPYWWVTNFGGMIVSGFVARRSKSRFVKLGFALAVTTHVVEAVYAYGTARRAGLDDAAPAWGLQTLGVGFPSLQALHEVLRERETPETVDAQ